MAAVVTVQLAPVVSPKQASRYVWRLQRTLGSKTVEVDLTTRSEAVKAFKAEINGAREKGHPVDARFLDATGGGEEASYATDGTMTRKPIKAKDGLLGPRCFVTPITTSARKAQMQASRPAKGKKTSKPAKVKPAKPAKPAKAKPASAKPAKKKTSAPPKKSKLDGRAIRMKFMSDLKKAGHTPKQAAAAWNRLPADHRVSLAAAMRWHEATPAKKTTAPPKKKTSVPPKKKTSAAKVSTPKKKTTPKPPKVSVAKKTSAPPKKKTTPAPQRAVTPAPAKKTAPPMDISALMGNLMTGLQNL